MTAQLVLAASNELITAMKDGAPDAVDSVRSEITELAARAEYTYPPGRELTAERFLDHLRSAFSQPVPQVTADWVKDGKVHHRWRNKRQTTVAENLKSLEKEWGCAGWPYVAREGRYYCVFSTETQQKYVPFFSVTLTLDELNWLSRMLGDAYKFWPKTLEPGIVKALLTPGEF